MNKLWDETAKCDQLGGSFNGWCKDVVKQRWLQDLLGPRVYPWINLQWDYQQYIKNNYNPVNLGIDRSGNAEALVTNIGILIKQLNSLLMDPNPADSSRAGVSDQPMSNNPFKDVYLNLKGQIIQLKQDPVANASKINILKEAVAMMEKNRQITAKEFGLGINLEASYQSAPYNDPYFNKPTDGKASSSYFVQTGFCKTKDNETDCKTKKLNWLGDVCYKDKYMYLDNTPGLKLGYVENMNGLIPSLLNEATQLNPNAFTGILQGYSVPGVDIQQCLDEHFQNKQPASSYKNLLIIIFVSILLYFILDNMSKKYR
jgi:hypothetical protein